MKQILFTFSLILCLLTTASKAQTASSLDFDGVNDYVDLGSSASLKPTAALTAECWANMASWTGSFAIISNANNSGYELYANGVSLFGRVRRNGSYAATAYPLASISSGWHHFALTFDGRYTNFYVDGSLVDTDDAGAVYAITYVANNTLLGAEASAGAAPTPGYYFNGNIDDLRLWNRALCQQEILNNLNCEIATTGSGLLANYHFNQGTSGSNNVTVTSLTDASGNANTGALNSFALIGSSSNWVNPHELTSGVFCAAFDPEINLIGNGITIANGDNTPSLTDHTNFGTVCANQTIVRTYTIQNTGTGNLSISSITLTGADASLFATSTLSPISPIVAASSAVFSVSFTPTSSGVKTATLSILNNDCDESPYNFNISGTANALPTVSASASNTFICRNATVTVNGSGANTYTWTGGVTNGVAFTPTSTIAYTVSGTSTAGCTSTNVAAITITVNTLPTLTATASNTFICRNQTVTVNGAGANTYTWTGGVTNGVAFSPTATANYTVTGTSAAGCTGTNVAAITITVNAIPTVTASSSATAICRNQTVTVNGSGASTYTWTGGATNGVAFSPTATATYTVIGTSTAGCTSTNVAVRTITVRPLPTVTAGSSATVICRNQTVTVNGGGASTYTWSGGVTNNVAFSPTATATYTVVGTSAAGCTSTNVAVRTITVNALPTLTATASNTFICRNASVTLNGAGANTYTWTGGVTNGLAFSPTATANYTVTGTSTAGCTGTNVAAITVTVNALPTVTANSSSTVICMNATVSLTGSGASTYTWTGGVTDGVAFSPTATATYTVIGTNTAGCTSTNVAVRTITVNALPTLTANATNTFICRNATVSLSGSGATTYTWTGGITNGIAFTPTTTVTYTVNGTNAAGCTNTNVASITVTVNALPTLTATASNTFICRNASVTLNGAGANTYTWTGGVTDGLAFSPTATANYTVTGTSTAGCTGTNVAAITVTVNALPTVTANSSSTVICMNATVSLTGSGASTYTWTGGVTDGVAFSPTATATYTVIGTNTAGCTSTNVAVRTITVNALPTLTASATNTFICRNATVSLSGSGAITYTWTGGVTNGIAFTPTTTVTYTVNGTNAAGCTNTNLAAITVTVNQTPTVTATASNTFICRNSTVTVNGIGANTYTWTGGVTDGLAFSPTATANYTVTGTSTAGCTSTNVAVVTITVNAIPTVSANSTASVICENATVTLTGSGANTYTWTGGAIDGVAFSPTATASYIVVGTSTAGCTSTNVAVKSITVNLLPILTANATNTYICRNSTVAVVATGALTYTWTGGVSNGVAFTPTSTNTYSATGTSTAGCTSTNIAVVTITVNQTPTVTANASNTFICRNSTVTLNGSGANTYTWTGGVIDGVVFSPTSTVTYTVSGTSTAACTSTNVAAITITVNAIPNVTANTTSSAICANATVMLSGTGASTYTWTGGVTDAVAFSPTATATYTVVGTSTAGCTSTNVAVRTVTVNSLPTVSASVSNSVICRNATITLSGSGAISYTWTGGAPNNIAFSPTVTSGYTVTGTNAAGCTNTNIASVTVTVNALPTVTANVTNSIICVNGTVALTGSGASTYTWTGGISNAVTFTPLVSTNYQVTGTSTAGCTSTNIAIQSVIVNALPVVSANSTSTYVCINTPVTLNGIGASTYTWTGGISNGVAFTPSTTSSYTLTGTSLAGCTSTNVLVKTIVVNPLPAVNAFATNTVICAGISATLTASGADVYTWLPGPLFGTLVNPVPLVPTTYTVTGTNTLTSCNNTAVISIQVNPTPIITLAVSSQTYCSGSAATITPSGASSYTLNPGGLTGSSFTVNPSTPTQYVVTGMNSFNCINLSPATTTISSNALTNIRGVFSSTTGMSGGYVTLFKPQPGRWDSITTVAITGNWPGVNYNFLSIPSGTYVVRGVPSSSFLPHTYGSGSAGWQSSTPIFHTCFSNSYQDVAVDHFMNPGNGKASMSGKILEKLTVSSPGTPLAGVIVKAGSMSLGRIVTQATTNAVGEYTLSKLPINQPFDKYFILVDIPGLDTNGTYHMVISTALQKYIGLDFIVDTAYITPTNPTVGLNELSVKNGLVAVYPNPTHSELNIEFTLLKNAELSINLMDITGRNLKEIVSSTHQPMGQFQMNTKLDDYTAGIYFIKIKVDKEERIIKVVKTN